MLSNGLFSELSRRNVFKVAIAYTVLSWLLIQVADVVFPALNLPEWSITMLLALLALGFVPVLVFAWVYELTPEGLKREEEVYAGQSITAETGRKINALIVVLLVVGIGAVILDRLVPETGRVMDTGDKHEDIDPEQPSASGAVAPRESSIAVLPFVNMSADPDQEYFSDGITEELLNALSRVPGLLVTSRTSAFSFKGKDVTITQIGHALGVAHILEGSVRKYGDKVRITAQLIDTERDVHLWSQSWDRTLDDVFAIQDEIAAEVVARMTEDKKAVAPAIARTDSETYNLFLEARYHARQGTKEGALKAIELYERVVIQDPDYMPAWLSLAGIQFDFALNAPMLKLDPDELFRKSRQAANRALAIDPNYGPVYSMLSHLSREADGDLVRAAEYIQKGLDLAPDDTGVLNAAAGVLIAIGRIDESVELFRVLALRNPLAPGSASNLALALYASGDPEGAAKSLDRALSLSPDSPIYHWRRALLYCLQGEYQACLEKFAALSEFTGDEMYRLESEALALPKLGREAEGAAALQRLKSGYGTRSAFVIALALVHQERYEESITYLNKLPPNYRRYVARNPDFAPLHGTRGWRDLMQQWGYLDEAVAGIELDLKLPR